MSHYFLEDKSLKDEYKTIEYTYQKNVLRLITNTGVFSRDRVDFGTNVLLNEIEITGNDILDVGCGYGIVGLAIAKAYPLKKITMIDINQKAIELSKENAKNNQINNVSVFQSDLYSNVNSKFDQIISNPPIRAGKQVVFGVVSDAREHLRENGTIWIVIQKKQGAESLVKKMNEVYGNCDIVDKINGYWILRSVNDDKK